LQLHRFGVQRGVVFLFFWRPRVDNSLSVLTKRERSRVCLPVMNQLEISAQRVVVPCPQVSIRDALTLSILAYEAIFSFAVGGAAVFSTPSVVEFAGFTRNDAVELFLIRCFGQFELLFGLLFLIGLANRLRRLGQYLPLATNASTRLMALLLLKGLANVHALARAQGLDQNMRKYVENTPNLIATALLFVGALVIVLLDDSLPPSKSANGQDEYALKWKQDAPDTSASSVPGFEGKGPLRPLDLARPSA